MNLAWSAGLFRVAGSFFGGCGVIFCLHRVVEPGVPVLYPGYKIHADVLEDLLITVREMGWEFARIDDVPRLLAGGRRFACFTFDDGYADNLTLALPLFRKHAAPLAVFPAISSIERNLFYWWGGCEDLVQATESIELPAIAGCGGRTLPARTFHEKLLAFRVLDDTCHRLGEAMFPVLRELFQRHGVDPRRSLDRDALTLTQLRELAADPLVTIGSHCLTHRRLTAMTSEEAYRELAESRRTLEAWLNTPIRHLAFPFGRANACGPREFALAREAGFTTALTTRQGNLFPRHRDHLHCLPRRTPPLNRPKTRAVLHGVQTLFERQPRFQTN